MQETTNYKLKKQELTDKADITQISGNWDTIDTELANKLDTSGGTITGELTIKGPLNMESPIRTTKAEILQTQVDVVKGVAPEATKYSYISMFDKNGWGIADNRLAHIDYMVGADGAASMVMSVNKFEQASGETAASLFVRYQADGTPRIFLSHHPKKESNSQDIATTGWVRQLAATTSEYGLVKLADTTAALLPTDPLATVNVPLLYELADYRRLNTAYNVGDRVACAFQFDFYLECTQAGTTGSETLDTRSVTHGQTINDGTVIWTVRKAIKSVNGALPDAAGNVTITAEAVSGAVQSVNGIKPDGTGNVTLDVEVDLSNLVDLTSTQTITGAKTFNTMEVSGSTVLRGQTSANLLHVTGAETNDSTLTVTGKTTLNGGVTIAGSATAPTPASTASGAEIITAEWIDDNVNNRLQDTVAAGSVGPSSNASPSHGGSFTVPQITVDAKGRVTAKNNRTITLPSAPSSSYTVTRKASRTTSGNWTISGLTTYKPVFIIHAADSGTNRSLTDMVIVSGAIGTSSVNYIVGNNQVGDASTNVFVIIPSSSSVTLNVTNVEDETLYAYQ